MLIFRICSGIVRANRGAAGWSRGGSEQSEHQHKMKTPTRKALRETLQGKGLEASLRIGKTGLTPKQRKFAEAVVLEGMNNREAYRTAYDHAGKPETASVEAWKLRQNPKVAQTIEALERAKELSAWQSAESLRALVISTLTEIATDEHTKAATRVSAVKVLGTVVGVDAFRETKRIEHIQDSGEIKAQIMDQLKTLMLGSQDAQDVDADSLLAELAGDDAAGDEPHPGGDTPNQEWDSDPHMHTIPHEPTPEFKETPPLSEQSQTHRGDIFGKNDEVAK